MPDPVVESDDRRDRYEVTNPAGQSVFTYTFPLFSFDGAIGEASSGIAVYVDDELLDEADYTVDEDAMTVTLDTPAAQNSIVVLEGATLTQRIVSYPLRGGLPSARLNSEAQQFFFLIQELLRDRSRSAILSPSSGDNVSGVLPTPTAGRALRWNAAGTALENSASDLAALEAATLAVAVIAAAVSAVAAIDDDVSDIAASLDNLNTLAGIINDSDFVSGSGNFSQSIFNESPSWLVTFINTISGDAMFWHASELGFRLQIGLDIVLDVTPTGLETTSLVAGTLELGTALAVDQGGTGATTAAAARTSLAAAGLTGNETIAGNKTFSGTTALQALLDISHASAGQIKFPATQNASADANTLDDYEEGTWTPAGTFATPGNLVIAYTAQVGTYTKIGREITLRGVLLTSTFTHTTASGNFQISGIPFAHATVTNLVSCGAAEAWSGITKAGYTFVAPIISSGGSLITLTASGSGVTSSAISATDTPSGGSFAVRFNIKYQA